MSSTLTRIHRILENCNYDIIILTETWISDHHLDAEIASSSWQITRFDRPGDGLGGGVLVAVKSNLPCSSVSIDMTNLNTFTSQQCWVKIILDSKDIYCGCFYLREHQSHEDYYNFINASTSVIDKMKTEDICFIFGDFNLRHIMWDKVDDDESFFEPSNITTDHQEKVLQFFAEKGLGQICNLQNRAGYVLDLVFTNALDNFELKEIDSIFNKSSVFHKCFDVKYLYAFNNLNCNSVASSKTVFDFKNADFPKITEQLRELALDPNWSIDRQADHFIDQLSIAIETFVPKKVLTIRNKAPWHDSTYFRLKNRRNRDFKRWRSEGTEQLKSNFLQSREELEIYDEHSYEIYMRKAAEKIKQNSREFWKCLDYKRQTNGYPNSMSYNNVFKHNNQDICKLFKDFFQSVYSEPQAIQNDFNELPMSIDSLTDLTLRRESLLKELQGLDLNKGPGPDGIPTIFLRNVSCYIVDPLLTIFNRSLKEGYFPSNWKTSNITPIFKNGDRSKVENYRGISMLSVIPKLFEKLVTEQIVEFLVGKINEHQHGFHQGRSTTSNLSYYVSNLLLGMEHNKQVDAIYTDFSKAFDKVNHDILEIKLTKIGIRGDLLKWLKSYLSERTQKVKVNGFLSEAINVTSGVPQGSHLGPVLFNIFINDLTLNINYCNYLLYADDMKLYGNVNQISDTLLIQNDLNNISTWCTKNLMFLSVPKCNVISFSRRKDIISSNYSIDNVILKKVSTIRDLGITLDNKINFNHHIDKMTNNARRTLAFVKRRSKEFKDPYVTKSLYCSLVRSKLEYASVVWNTDIENHISKIESVQKQFLLFALRNLGWRRDTFILPSYGARLKLLNMDSLKDRRQNFDTMFAFDLIRKNIKCTDLCNKIVFNAQPPQNLRSRRLLFVALHTRNYTYNEPFSRVSRSFNNVSNLYDESISRMSFKKKLKSI